MKVFIDRGYKRTTQNLAEAHAAHHNQDLSQLGLN